MAQADDIVRVSPPANFYMATWGKAPTVPNALRRLGTIAELSQCLHIDGEDLASGLQHVQKNFDEVQIVLASVLDGPAKFRVISAQCLVHAFHLRKGDAFQNKQLFC